MTNKERLNGDPSLPVLLGQRNIATFLAVRLAIGALGFLFAAFQLHFQVKSEGQR
jgi:hypothetical protein